MPASLTTTVAPPAAARMIPPLFRDGGESLNASVFWPIVCGTMV
jgi:hypothetical protein